MTNFYDLDVRIIYKSGNVTLSRFSNINSSEYNELLDKMDYLKANDNWIEEIKIKENVWTY